MTIARARIAVKLDELWLELSRLLNDVPGDVPPEVFSKINEARLACDAAATRLLMSE